jgi:uncharacterized membrane protein
MVYVISWMLISIATNVAIAYIYQALKSRKEINNLNAKIIRLEASLFESSALIAEQSIIATQHVKAYNELINEIKSVSSSKVINDIKEKC